MNDTSTLWDTLVGYYHQIGHLNSFWLLVLCALIFMPLAFFFPHRKQPLLHKGMIADSLYWVFAGPFLYAPLSQLLGQMVVYGLIAGGIYTVERVRQIQYGLPPISELPVLLQAFLILLVMDLMQYWTHRLFHTMKFWKFHAIHHSATHVDWLTSARFHPVNIVIHSTLVGIIVYMVGFSPEAWAVLGPFNAIYSPLVHANVNWTYGPFRYVLASPVFHRWHHTYTEEGGNKNFAPTFPLIDIVFGTYYDPRDKKPEVFGIEGDPVSDSIWDQLVYPFRRKNKQSITAGEQDGQV